MINSLLLASFVRRNEVNSVVDIINDNFDVIGNRIFLLTDIDKPFKNILTYNIVKNGETFSDYIKNTISLHRKKESNTLFTVNALNELVKSINEGKTDNSISVNWDYYSNCILLTNNINGRVELKRINTKLLKIINMNRD